MSSHPFRVGRSRTGLGLFATEDIAKNAFIMEYLGPKLSTRQAEELEAKGSNRYLFELNSRWTIDGSARNNVARYTNHSCRPNAEAHVSRGRIVFRASKRIRPGDEITFNYGRSYFDIFIKPVGCKCVKCDPVAEAAPAAAKKQPRKSTASSRASAGAAKPRTTASKAKAASKPKGASKTGAANKSKAANTTAKASGVKARAARPATDRAQQRRATQSGRATGPSAKPVGKTSTAPAARRKAARG